MSDSKKSLISITSAIGSLSVYLNSYFYNNSSFYDNNKKAFMKINGYIKLMQQKKILETDEFINLREIQNNYDSIYFKIFKKNN